MVLPKLTSVENQHAKHSAKTESRITQQITEPSKTKKSIHKLSIPLAKKMHYINNAGRGTSKMQMI